MKFHKPSTILILMVFSLAVNAQRPVVVDVPTNNIKGGSYFVSHQKLLPQQRPNIIFFLVDDMGWQDTPVPFWDSTTVQNKKFHTPNMERLAKQSMKFTNAYANSICTPSRVSLMTGMNAARHRVTNWTAFKDKAVDANDSLLKVPDWNVNGLSPILNQLKSVYATPLPQILKDNGYYTVQCGKAHFGAYQTVGANPLNLGFVKNVGGSAAGNPASYLAEDDFGYDPNHFILAADIPNMQQYWGTPTFLTEDLTKAAILAMDTARMEKKPFFLYMAHYAVHLPYNADKKFVQKYLDEAQTGEPALRPLSYNYPLKRYENIKDQFMMGDEILVAPVVT